jgi:hypothetical protein
MKWESTSEEQKKRKPPGKTAMRKLGAVRQVNKNGRSKVAHAYGIPLSTLSQYLKNYDSVEQQVLQVDDILNCMRIHGAEHGDMESEVFEWF